MSIKTLTHRLERLEEKRAHLLAEFTQSSPLIVGSITHTKGRCGKPHCACAEKPTHEITLLMTSEGGKKTSHLIRKDDIEDVLGQWQKYKTLKKMIGTLKQLNQEEIEVLQQLIQERKRTYKRL